MVCRVSNCVGHRNYRYFVSFLFWATVATGYVSVLSGVLLCQKGSLLFPANGQSITTALSRAIIGSLQNNVYTNIYDMLTNEDSEKIRRNRKKHKDGAWALREHTEEEASTQHNDRRTTAVDDGSAEQSDSLHHLGAAEYIDLHQLSATRRLESSLTVEDTLRLPESFRKPRHTPHDRLHVQRRHHNPPLEDVDPSDPTADAPILAADTDMRPPTRPQKVVMDGSHAMSISVIGPLLWVAPKEMLVFIAFMLSFGVCLGTGSLLSFHIYLSKPPLLLFALLPGCADGPPVGLLVCLQSRTDTRPSSASRAPTRSNTACKFNYCALSLVLQTVW